MSYFGTDPSAPPIPPIAPPPEGAVLTTAPVKRTWVFYAFAGAGVLAGVTVLGALFLRHRRTKRTR